MHAAGVAPGLPRALVYLDDLVLPHVMQNRQSVDHATAPKSPSPATRRTYNDWIYQSAKSYRLSNAPDVARAHGIDEIDAWGHHIADVIFTIDFENVVTAAPIWQHGVYYRAAHRFVAAEPGADGERVEVERSVLYPTIDAAAARLALEQRGTAFTLEMLPTEEDEFGDIAPTPPPIREDQINWDWPERAL